MSTTPTEPVPDAITGVILAGGAGRRMGGRDKGLIPFAGRPLVEWVIDALSPQVRGIMISANRNLETYARYGLEVVQDAGPGFQGPLAGILGAMRTARTPWILTLPCDGPCPPVDLGRRLSMAVIAQKGDLAVAADQERRHAVHALLPTTLADDLAAFLEGGERKVELWQSRHRVVWADFSDCPKGFRNLNTAADAQALEAELREHDSTAQALGHRTT